MLKNKHGSRVMYFWVTAVLLASANGPRHEIRSLASTAGARNHRLFRPVVVTAPHARPVVVTAPYASTSAGPLEISSIPTKAPQYGSGLRSPLRPQQASMLPHPYRMRNPLPTAMLALGASVIVARIIISVQQSVKKKAGVRRGERASKVGTRDRNDSKSGLASLVWNSRERAPTSLLYD